MATSTWERRERPILEAVLACEEEAGVRPTNKEITDRTGLDPGVVGRTLEALREAGFVAAEEVTAFGSDHPEFLEVRLIERGRREIGQWPPTVADAFLDKLDYLIANAADEDTRTRLRKLRDAAGEVSKGVVSSAIVAAVQHLFSP